MDPLQNEKLFHTLQALGLTATEIQVYLNCLRLGSTSASTLSRRANLNRSTTRYTLENLVKKKLITQADKNGTFYFTPEDPEKILLNLRNQKNEIEQQEALAGKIIGDLKALKNPYSRLPKVQYYEGVEGFQKAYRSVLEELESGDEIWGYVLPVNKDIDYHGLTPFVADFMKERSQKGITSKVLIFQNHRSDWIRSDTKLLRETRLMPRNIGLQSFPSETMIYKDTICSFSVNEHSVFAYKVTQADMTQVQKELFLTLWDQSNPA